MSQTTDHTTSDSPRARPSVVRAHPKWFERLPFAPWGFWEIVVIGLTLMLIAAALIAVGGAWAWLAVIPGAIFAQLLYFFRDPPRTVPAEGSAIVAPADGTIVEVTPLEHDDFVGGPAVRIGIFLSIFNVHINRNPCAGRVIQTHYKPGEFLDARKPESALRNESMWIGFETTEGPPRRFAVRQISGLIARRIVCLLEPGEPVARGVKFGMIKLGSRTELVLPRDAVEVTVAVGDKVCAGSDTVAHWISLTPDPRPLPSPQ